MSQSQTNTIELANSASGDLSAAELSKYRGQWLAFSADGFKLIASGATLKELESQLAAAGQNPDELLLDWITPGGAICSGSELS